MSMSGREAHVLALALSGARLIDETVAPYIRGGCPLSEDVVTLWVVPELESGAAWRVRCVRVCGKQAEVVGCQLRLPLDHMGNNLVSQAERGSDGSVCDLVVCFSWRAIDPGLHARGLHGFFGGVSLVTAVDVRVNDIFYFVR